MKTYKEFSQELYEFKGVIKKFANSKINNAFSKYQPIKGITRITNAKDMVGKNKSIGDRISSGIGVVKPYDIGGMLMKPIFDQGQKGSLVNKGVDYLAKQNNKVKFLPKAGSDPKTDIGKRASDFISKKFNKVFNRRNQNLGANDLKKSSPNMG